MISTVVLIFLFYLSIVQSICPQNGVYVSTNGSDTTGDGTVDKPFRNVTTAYNKIRTSQNGTICIQPGNYFDVHEIWNDTCSVNIVAVDEVDKPIFTSLYFEIYNPGLTIENFMVNSDCVFSLSGTNLIMDDIESPLVIVNVLSPNTTLIFSGLNVSESLQIFPYLSDPFCDVQVKDSILGGLHCTSNSVFLSECFFSKPVYLNARNTITYACEFQFIQSTENILNIRSFNWINAKHEIKANKFINNTVSVKNFDSVISLLFPPNMASVIFQNNIFSCNMLVTPGQTPSVARVLPYDTDVDNWVIDDSNSINPVCPYLCEPGSQPVLNGIAGCAQCVPGYFSSGHTLPCTPCPAGTYSNIYKSINCTACEPGMYAPGENNTICTYCIKSTPSQNKTACVPCPSNSYPIQGLCQKCKETDEKSLGCLECGFFTTVESDCKQLSVSGIVVIVIVVGLVITLTVVFFCVRKRGLYTTIS